MPVCTYCETQSENRIPLYHICCEANMIQRCVDIVNNPYDVEHSDDSRWLEMSESTRQLLTRYHRLAEMAYKCYYDMSTLLQNDEMSYKLYKIENAPFNSESPVSIIYINIQLLSGASNTLHLYRITDTNVGEQCYWGYLDECRTYQRRRVRNFVRHITSTRESDTHNISSGEESDNDSIPSLIEDSSDDETVIVKKEDLDVKENAVEATDCYICLDTLGNTNKMILRCGHQFCGDCIFKHYNASRIHCPVCRGQYVVY